MRIGLKSITAAIAAALTAAIRAAPAADPPSDCPPQVPVALFGLALPRRMQNRADCGHPRRPHHTVQWAKCIAGDLHLR